MNYKDMLKLTGWTRYVVTLLVVAASACSTAGVGYRGPAQTDNPTCDVHLNEGLHKYSFHKNLMIPEMKRAQAKLLATKYGVTLSYPNFFNLVNEVYQKILETKGQGLNAADKMAIFGEELDVLVIGETKPVRQAVWFAVGNAVASLEEFKVSEFRTVTGDTHRVAKYFDLQKKFKPQNNPTGLLHFHEYPEYSKAYIEKQAPYTQHIDRKRYSNERADLQMQLDWETTSLTDSRTRLETETDTQQREWITGQIERSEAAIRTYEVQLAALPEVAEQIVNGQTFRIAADRTTFIESGGILSLPAYRDIVAHNMWPLWLAPHDMYHVHFASGHAKGVSLVFKSARSRNHRRFILMGGMYEGVDTFQYAHESSLARYFSETMQMGLEDALLWIAKSSRKELKTIIEKAGLDIKNFEEQFKDYVPGIQGNYTGTGITGKGLEKENEDFVELSAKHVRDPVWSKYTNYHRSAPDTAGSTWDKDFAHHGNMMTMPSPSDVRPTLPTDTPFDFDHTVRRRTR